MKTASHFLRFAFRLSIRRSTSALDTLMSLRARSSNAAKPSGFLALGFFFSILGILSFDERPYAGVGHVVDRASEGQASADHFCLLPVSHDVNFPRLCRHAVEHADDTQGNRVRLPHAGLDAVPPHAALKSLCGHLLNPHKARIALSGQGAVGNSFAHNRQKHFVEPAGIAALATIEPERLFVHVAEQVERGHGNIGASQRSLEQAPKVLDAVRVNAAFHVFDRVVDNAVGVVGVQAVVAGRFVRVDRRALADVPVDDWLQGALLRVAHGRTSHVATTLQDAMHDGLTDRTTALDLGFPLRLVHVAGLPAYEGFVRLDFTLQLAERPGFHRLSNPVQYEPSGFLGYVQGSAEFVAADAVLSVGDAPDSNEPLIEAKWAVLENGADLGAELLTASDRLALEQMARFDLADFLAAALGANHLAVRPLDDPHVFVADSQVREVADGFNQGLRNLVGHHGFAGFSFFGGLSSSIPEHFRHFEMHPRSLTRPQYAQNRVPRTQNRVIGHLKACARPAAFAGQLTRKAPVQGSRD